MAIDDNTLYGLTGAQVKELPEKVTGKIDARIKTNAGAPTTSTVGEVGQLLEDTTNGDLYICTAVDAASTPAVYTWSRIDAGGKAIKTLTTANYNYPANNPDTVGLWLLSDGLYDIAPSTSVMIAGSEVRNPEQTLFAVYEPSGSGVAIITALNASPDDKSATYVVSKSDGTLYESGFILRDTMVADSLTSTSAISPLSAKQGKILNEKIEGRIKTNAGAPTTSTVGTVGQLLADTTNGELYQCTAVDTTSTPAVYTWEEVGTEGQIRQLTTADFNWNSNTGDQTTPYNSVALWLLPQGIYSRGDNTVAVTERRYGLLDGSFKDFIVSPEYVLDNVTYKNAVCFGAGGGTAMTVTKMDVTTPGNNESMSVLDFADIYSDSHAKSRVRIGNGSSSTQDGNVAIGQSSTASGTQAIAVGNNSSATANHSIALGSRASATVQGQFDIGYNTTSSSKYGYNNSAYRLLTGLYDPQSAHDAATKGYVDTAISDANAFRVLTSADYNWNNTAKDTTTTPLDSIALWELDEGFYQWDILSGNLVRYNTGADDFINKTFFDNSIDGFDSVTMTATVGKKMDLGTGPDTVHDVIPIEFNVFGYEENSSTPSSVAYNGFMIYDSSQGETLFAAAPYPWVFDGLNSDSPLYSLSANQGRVLKNTIDERVVRNNVPSTTVGSIGTINESPTNGKVSVCYSTSNNRKWDNIITHKDIFAETSDNVTKYAVKIGDQSDASYIGNNSINIFAGNYTVSGAVSGDGAILAGLHATAPQKGAIALGAYATTTSVGQMNIGTSDTTYGYNSTNYRLLSGVHDPQGAHDAATKGYVDSAMPTFTMTTTDPGEGQPLAANNFIAVYEA